MQNFKKTIFTAKTLIVTGSLFLAFAARADDKPKHGVSPDGQAYRVDKDGNQLVDYIAELEVNVDALEKRVYGLQDDLKQKQAQIDRLQKSEPATSAVTERNITEPRAVNSVSCPACARCDDRSKEMTELSSAAQESKSDAVKARAELAKSQAELSRTQEQLGQGTSACRDEVAHASTLTQTSKNDASQARAELAKIQSELSRSQAEREQEGVTCRDEVARASMSTKNTSQQMASLQESLEKTSADFRKEQKLRQQYQEESAAALSSKQSEIDSLQDKILDLQVADSKAQAKAQLREAPSVVAATGGSYRATNSYPATLARPEPAYSTVTLSSATADLNAARTRAATELRSEVSSGLAHLQAEIQTRDSLFSHFDQHDRALKIGPSRLITSDGATPESISQRLASATAVRDLVQLRDNVRVLEGKVGDDIAVVRRMSAKR